MIARSYLIGAALLFAGGIGLGWWARGAGAKKVATVATQKADQITAAATAALQQGVQHVQAAKAQDPAIAAAHSAVAASRARLQMDQAARAARPVRPAGAPASEPAGVALGLAVDRDKDRLITAQAQEIALLRAQGQEKDAAIDALQAAASGFQQAGQVLRPALAQATLPEHPWAAGVIYGTGRAIGAFIERDFGPFRAGVDVIRRQLPAGPATIDTSARLGWRF